MASKNTFYVTTPIYYVNSKPHVGTLYSTLLADVAARYAQLMGKETFFMTGTDEHGQKIQEKAASLQMEPKTFVDSMIEPFKKVWDLYNLKYSKFIRTTDVDHEQAVCQWIKELMAKGDIYKSHYEGYYCVSCENFISLTEEELVAVNHKPICETHKRALDYVKEESYFFRLSSYQQELLDLYETRPDFIYPKERMAEVVSFVKAGLKDLSISRKNITWGIPFPGDPEHVVYVWGDALNNYITGVGYGKPGAEHAQSFKKWWPAELHVMAKDIVRFHAVFWPAFLMAAGLDLPKHLLVHGYILMGDQKMSKSLGNAIDPTELAAWYGVDQVRYYLMRQMPIGHDGLFSLKDLEERITSDLANNLGNLLNRTITLAHAHDYARPVSPVVWEPSSAHLKELCLETYRAYADAMAHYNYHKALHQVWSFIAQVNAYFHAQQPWVQAKNNREFFKEIIASSSQALQAIGIMLMPFMPTKMTELLECLGVTLTPGTNYDQFLRKNAWNQEFVLTKKEAPLFVRPESHLSTPESAEQDAVAGQPSEKISLEKKTSQPAPALDEGASQGTEFSAISIDDFAKCQLLVGTIVACEKVAGSQKMLKLSVDMGAQEGVRTILSGVAQHFSPDDLLGKQGVYVANLAPRKMMGMLSQGMMLFADDGTGSLRLVTVEHHVANGTRLK